jgi:hypothetical protein
LERELLKGVCVKGRKPTQSLHPQKKKKKSRPKQRGSQDKEEVGLISRFHVHIEGLFGPNKKQREKSNSFMDKQNSWQRI